MGLRPKEGTVHYPVIYTVRCPLVAFPDWHLFTHIIFTSQTAVEYWPGPWDKQILAIGNETAQKLREKGLEPVVAPEATQEGIMKIVGEGYYFIPRSKRARGDLDEYMRARGIRFQAFDLYETHFQKPLPVPDLNEFDEVIFTSPSTVEGFLRIFGKFPEGKKLTAIGPITSREISFKKSNFPNIMAEKLPGFL